MEVEEADDLDFLVGRTIKKVEYIDDETAYDYEIVSKEFGEPSGRAIKITLDNGLVIYITCSEWGFVRL